MITETMKLSELQALVQASKRDNSESMFRSIQQSMKAEGYTVTLGAVRASAKRVLGWEPSDAQPILDEAAEIVAIEEMVDLASLCYCDVYHWDERPIISNVVGDHPITCLNTNDELPPSCLDDES